ncbi:hypothetical protein [Methylogaea oryzae]|uniref:hypothetical protein n=1 Tax=Methylogaea oryzae TaxID=1295382 RepID=UPI001C3F266E|nr:hypothetical protein [Methylogaea oryzae]
MIRIDVTVLLIACGAMYVGNTAFKAYLRHRYSLRERQLMLEAQQALSQQETERARIIANLLHRT